MLRKHLTILYPSGNPSGYKFQETRDYAYTGHFFAEYRYHFSQLFSLGMQADFDTFKVTSVKTSDLYDEV